MILNGVCDRALSYHRGGMNLTVAENLVDLDTPNIEKSLDSGCCQGNVKPSN